MGCQAGIHEYTLSVYLDDTAFAAQSYAVHTETFTVEVVDPC